LASGIFTFVGLQFRLLAQKWLKPTYFTFGTIVAFWGKSPRRRAEKRGLIMRSAWHGCGSRLDGRVGHFGFCSACLTIEAQGGLKEPPDKNYGPRLISLRAQLRRARPSIASSLFGAGIAGLAIFRRRRKAKARNA
jgi:hypothetical protein